MKKKIKDLTLGECRDICCTHTCGKDGNCPLWNDILHCLRNSADYEREVEVDE